VLPLRDLPADVPAPAAGPLRARSARRRALVAGVCAAAAVASFLVYLRASQTYPGDSYGAVFTLQAWDMLHGNVILHGWWLSDVSFYSTELPEYMLVELVLGRSPDVVHAAAAITFTLLLLLAVALARGRTTGREAAVRMAITAGIMCSPQLGPGIFLFLLAPDHLGSAVPVLAAWLIIDRAPQRWYGPVAVGALLAATMLADSIVALTGVAPVVAVGAARLYARVVGQRQPLRAQWYEASLIAAGVAAVAVAAAAAALLRAAGGFRLNPVNSQLTTVAALPGHVYSTVAGLTLVFGGDFFGRPFGVAAALLLLHLAGLVLAAWAVGAGLRRIATVTLVDQLLITGLLLNLAAFGLWTSVTSLSTTREIVAVLPFGAVLAARLLAARLTAARLLPILAVVACGYLVSLGGVAAHAPARPAGHQLTTWLAAHGFRYGVGNSALGSVVTVSSGERVILRPLRVTGGRAQASRWEAEQSWYDPRRHDATFAVLLGASPSPAAIRATFGPPARTYHVGPYTVLAYHHNLLAQLP
jgi:hypothetical protein